MHISAINRYIIVNLHRVSSSPGRGENFHVRRSSSWPAVRLWFYQYIRIFRYSYVWSLPPPIKAESRHMTLKGVGAIEHPPPKKKTTKKNTLTKNTMNSSLNKTKLVHICKVYNTWHIHWRKINLNTVSLNKNLIHTSILVYTFVNYNTFQTHWVNICFLNYLW